MTWWCANDRYRYSSIPFDQGLEGRCIQNMRCLFNLLDADDANNCIMKAEIARELGDFGRTIELAMTIDDENAEHVKLFLLGLCRQKATTVRLIPKPKDA